MASSLTLSFEEIQVVRDALLRERRSNDEVLEIMRTSDPSDLRVPPLVVFLTERGAVIEKLLSKIV